MSMTLREAFNFKKDEVISDQFHGLYLDKLMPRKQYLEPLFRKAFFQTKEFVYEHSSRSCNAWYEVIKGFLDDNTPFDLFKDIHEVDDWEYLSVQCIKNKNGDTDDSTRQHLHSKRTKINLKLGELINMVCEKERNPRKKMNYSSTLLFILSKLTL